VQQGRELDQLLRPELAEVLNEVGARMFLPAPAVHFVELELGETAITVRRRKDASVSA
jgi:hypothetical protein